MTSILTAELDPPDACPRCFPGDAPACLPLSPKSADGSYPYSCGSCGTAWRTTFDEHWWPAERTIATAEDAARRRAA